MEKWNIIIIIGASRK